MGINNITNIINGTPYGIMKTWNSIEVENYGTMILYKALKMCINDPPRIIHSNDVVLPREKFVRPDWEMDGILQCFLEL